MGLLTWLSFRRSQPLPYEAAPLGVHVTLVKPGNVKTDFTASHRTAPAAGGDPVSGAALTKAVGPMERDADIDTEQSR
jgi:short-subunit dehydrogenase